MVKHGGERYGCQRKNSCRSTQTAKLKSVPPASGHTGVYFTTGSTKDATVFQDTIYKLARHVSTASG